MGDFNRDLFQENLKKTCHLSYFEYIETFGLKQIIESPTRVTDNSRTLNDHKIAMLQTL